MKIIKRAPIILGFISLVMSLAFAIFNITSKNITDYKAKAVNQGQDINLSWNKEKKMLEVYTNKPFISGFDISLNYDNLKIGPHVSSLKAGNNFRTFINNNTREGVLVISGITGAMNQNGGKIFEVGFEPVTKFQDTAGIWIVPGQEPNQILTGGKKKILNKEYYLDINF